MDFRWVGEGEGWMGSRWELTLKIDELDKRSGFGTKEIMTWLSSRNVNV